MNDKNKDRHLHPVTSIRFNEEELANIDELAVYLHKAGVFGVTDRNGKAIKRSVISYVIEKVLKEYKSQESEG